MLTPDRRSFLAGAIASLAVSACGRVPAPPTRPAAPSLTPAFDAWRTQAFAMLNDALETLHTFEAFAAYRVATAESSDLRPASTLAWDPPTGTAWDNATHVARGLHGRADQLVQAITTAQVDPDLWRERRVLADQVHDLIDVGDVLGAYRDRVDRIPLGDASSAWALLDRAWLQWDAAAARFGVTRFEHIGSAP